MIEYRRAEKAATLDDVAAEVEPRLRLSIQTLLDSEPALFYVGVGERALAAWLFHYMLPIFHPWDVDPEYNRHLGNPKRSHVKGRKAREAGNNVTPDVVVHLRRNEFDNLLIIEAKPKHMGEGDDRQKLASYLKEDGKLRYKFAAFVVFGWDGRPWCKCELYDENGNPVSGKDGFELHGANPVPEIRLW